MFVSSLFVIAKNSKQPRYPPTGEWINCGTSISWMSNKKEQTWSTQQLACISRLLCWWKAKLTRLHMVWFHLFNILKMKKIIVTENRLMVPGLRVGKLLWSDGMILCSNYGDHYMNLLHVIKFYRTIYQKNYVYLQGSGKPENVYLHSLFVFTDFFYV